MWEYYISISIISNSSKNIACQLIFNPMYLTITVSVVYKYVLPTFFLFFLWLINFSYNFVANKVIIIIIMKKVKLIAFLVFAKYNGYENYPYDANFTPKCIQYLLLNGGITND